MSDKDGGEAFPWAECGPRGGMSLRDYFAGRALARLADFPSHEEVADGFNRTVAKQAYRLADAMLEARKR